MYCNLLHDGQWPNLAFCIVGLQQIGQDLQTASVHDGQLDGIKVWSQNQFYYVCFFKNQSVFLNQAGLVTNSILFCWLFAIEEDWCKKCIFKKSWSLLKKPVRGPRRRRRSCWEERKRIGVRGHWFALQANQWVFTKRKQKKIELMARPGSQGRSCTPASTWIWLGGHKVLPRLLRDSASLFFRQ